MPSSGFKGVSWNNRMKAWLTFYYDNKVRRSRTFHPKNYNDDIQESLKAAIEFAKTVNTGPRAASNNLNTLLEKSINKKARLVDKHISKWTKYSDRIKSVKNKKLFPKVKKPIIKCHEDFLEDLNTDLNSKNWLRSSLSPNFPVQTSTDKFDFVSIADLVGSSQDLKKFNSFSNNDFLNLTNTQKENLELEGQGRNNILLELQFSENKRDIFTFDPEQIQQAIDLFSYNRNVDDDRPKLSRKSTNDSILFSPRFSNSWNYKSYSSFTTALILKQGSSIESTSAETPTQLLPANSIERMNSIFENGSFYSRNNFFEKIFNPKPWIIEDHNNYT